SGDLIFHTSLSAQSKAIQAATKSKYSHCGIVYREGNRCYVLEAVQPVKTTPLDQWIARGQNQHYVVKRLKNADQMLTPAVLAKMQQIGRQFVGKDYDLAFGWGDEKIYCSELIWKVYQRAVGIEIGRLQKLQEFDLTGNLVKQKLKERYGNRIPLDETVISPAAVFNSDLLVTVKEQ
ncbi:MAG: YiiX family permuted papain-like enzyme, partial [Cytophagales bacterium]|nr:YiiX family permuted papain-like enzyme [Cytophagales bacterium]